MLASTEQNSTPYQVSIRAEYYALLGLSIQSFTLPKITVDVLGKKVISFPKGWQTISSDPGPDEIAAVHLSNLGALAVLTGKKSGITVLDFDHEGIYQSMLEKFPLLACTKTTKTHNGRHIYFNYDQDLKNTVNVLPELNVDDKGVDIRNDGGCAFHGPTQYTIAGTIAKYESNGVDSIIDMPKGLRAMLSPKAFKSCPTKSPDIVWSPEIARQNAEKRGEVEISELMAGNEPGVRVLGEFERNILDNIDASNYKDYDLWIKFIAGVKFSFASGDALDIADRYSQRAPNYRDKSDVAARMDSIKEKRIGWDYLVGLSKKSNAKKHTLIVKAETEKAANGEYEVRKTEFELTHCKIVNRQLYVKIVGDKVALWSAKDLQHSMLHLPPVGKRTFYQAWTSDPNIRLFDDIGIFPPPLKCPANIFNMWTGFPLERVTEWTPNQEGLECVRKHLLIMCGNEPAVAEYMEKWLGQALQFPATKTVAPVFISKQGAGKGSFIDFVRMLVGQSKVFETSKPAKDVWGPFNGLMQDAFIVNLDELSKKDTAEATGMIKALITNTALTINRKGIDAYPIDSYHRFISTTNSEDPMPTSEDDRRMLIIRASDELIGDTEYFKKFRQCIADPDVARTCFEYFHTLPGLQDFGSIKIPQTAHQTNLKELAVGPLELWMKDFTLENHDADKVELTSAAVYISYREWCRANMPDFKVITSQQLGVRIKNSPIVGIEKGQHTRTGETRVFDIVKLKKYFGISDVLASEEKEEIDGL